MVLFFSRSNEANVKKVQVMNRNARADGYSHESSTETGTMTMMYLYCDGMGSRPVLRTSSPLTA